jgi:hypothetical protein
MSTLEAHHSLVVCALVSSLLDTSQATQSAMRALFKPRRLMRSTNRFVRDGHKTTVQAQIFIGRSPEDAGYEWCWREHPTKRHSRHE